MSILQGITQTINTYKRETGSDLKEIIIDRREFDSLLSELENNGQKWASDPYLGISLYDVMIGWRDDNFNMPIFNI